MFDKKKLTIAIVIGLCIAILFWTQSRLPQLNEKAQMGSRTNISAIAFDIIYPTSIEDSYYMRVAKTAINWAYTNWKGMTFGLLFAAAFLTFFMALPKLKTSKNSFLNSIKGIIIGIPLSVCVNCSTPIAYGMHRAGINLVMALSTLMSSPTLNIIVLTIAFSLLPFHLAIIKLISAILFILVILPLIIKLINQIAPIKPANQSLNKLKKPTKTSIFNSNLDFNNCEIPFISKNWIEAFNNTFHDYAKYLVFIIKMTLPLMLLAAIIGALLIETVSFTDIQTLEIGFWSLLAVAIIGTLLPVPIAFDIIVVTTLMTLGMPVGLAMALLFSLSIYSIYPAMIIARNISVPLSAAIFFFTVIAAMLVGLVSQQIDDTVRTTEATNLKKELLETKSIDTLSKAITECQTLNTATLQVACLETFINSDLANTVVASACARIEDISPSTLEVCQNSIHFNSILKESIAQLDINHCLQLDNTKSQGLCWMQYATQRAIDPNSILWCDTFNNPAIKQQCRAKIKFNRVARMQTEEACDIPLSDSEKNDCLQHLNDMKLSLGGDLASCTQLAELSSQRNCTSNMFILKINDEHDYGFCKLINDPVLIKQCTNYAFYDQAKVDNNKSLCENIDDYNLQSRCKIAIKLKKVEKTLTINTILFVDETITRKKHINAIDNATINTQPVSAPLLHWQPFYSDEQVNISYIDHKNRSSIALGKFRKVQGDFIGINNPVNFSISGFFDPFSYGRGIATGDANNDHWPDIAFATPNGIALYLNKGDGTFFSQPQLLTINTSYNGISVAFVDINNDGWQDLFLSTYGGYNYFFINTNGDFKLSHKLVEHQNDRIVTVAVGFADWDKDGDLDFVAGNWSYGTPGAFNPQFSKNQWLINNNNSFTSITPNELEGDTLSVLFTDLNQDNNIDLIIGNDREYPDHYYWGDSQGGLSTNNNELIPISSLNTMSIETADFNNDLRLDLFSSDMSFSIGKDASYCSLLDVKEDKLRCQQLLKGYAHILNFDANGCNNFVVNSDKQSCLLALTIHMANRNANSDLCYNIPNGYPIEKQLCINLSSRDTKKIIIDHQKYIKQQQSNVLLMQSKNGAFNDKAMDMGVSSSYWSWNAKAADLDNDEWQDIYVGNGYEFGTKNNEIHSNVFFHNQAGNYFKKAEQEFGLENFTNTSSYSYSDIDLDGDIDIISFGTLSTPQIFINEVNNNSSISIQLIDSLGNRSCISCKVIIHYGDNEHQIREIKLSGGFKSFDAPIVHFGLGKHTQINRIEVFWSTGGKTLINHTMAADKRYLIKRKEVF